MSQAAAELKIGLIGLDTSHVPAFTKLLNDSSDPYHVPGARVVAGYPGGSPDFELSIGRVEGFTQEIKNNYGVEILDTPLAVAQKSDAIILTAVDGRVHPTLFAEIAPLGKPTFIDKPFAVSSADAKTIIELAKQHNVAILSCSSLRYAQPLLDALAQEETPIIGADVYGPLAIQPTQGGLFWYGIHTVEMLYSIFGRGCRQVTTTTNENHDFVVGLWEDGRIGTIRGNRKGNNGFGALIHRENTTQFVNASDHPKPGYAGLLEQALSMFRGEKPDVEIEETLEIVRFIEAANQGRESGKIVAI
jgi:predicted dehydrogenase